MKRFNHKCVRYDRNDLRKFLKVSFALLILFIASIPLSTFVDAKDKDKKPKKPKDKSAIFNLSYLNPDAQFTSIDYSGIEYYLNGELLYVTNSLGLIEIDINKLGEQNFTMIFGGVRYEFIFNESITESIILNTKSIDALAMWDEIFMSIVNSTNDFNLNLLYFDGTSWVTIETFTAVESGMVQFNNLIMGEYALSSGIKDTSITFTIGQDMINYTDTMIVVPDKTEISITYFDSIFGTDYPVDLSTINYILEIWSNTANDYITIPENYYVAVKDDVLGMIVIYELLQSGNEYRICIGNAWNENYEFNEDVLTEIGLTAKSLVAEFLWSFESEPVNGTNFELFYYDGTDYISAGIYTTDINGKIIITELLPMGTYKFDDYATFDIVADDVVKTVGYTVESILGGFRTPAWISFGSVKSKLFSFLTIKINLYYEGE